MIIEHNLKEEFTCSGEYIIIYLILNSVLVKNFVLWDMCIHACTETCWSSLMLDMIEWLKQTSRLARSSCTCINME